MEASPISPKISAPSSHFGTEEIRYFARLLAALQNLPIPGVVKGHLERVQADGLDPLKIYEVAVEARPPHWMPAPPYEDVAP